MNNPLEDERDLIIKAARSYGYNQVMEEEEILGKVLLFVCKRYKEDKKHLPEIWLDIIVKALEVEDELTSED